MVCGRPGSCAEATGGHVGGLNPKLQVLLGFYLIKNKQNFIVQVSCRQMANGLQYNVLQTFVFAISH